MKKTAIILVPFAVDVDSNEEAEQLCSDIDETIALNIMSLLERAGIDGVNTPGFKPLDTVVTGYINWKGESN